MNLLNREFAAISQIRAFLIILLMLLGQLAMAQQVAPEGVKIEVVSVRIMNDREAAERSPDFIGPNIVVRLRLSSSTHGISFYGWKNSAIPAGYRVQQTDKGLVWLYGRGGTEKKPSSPGLESVLFGSRGDWIILPAHAAVEWEELDSTLFSGERHAFTAFLRRTSTENPSEIVSDFFIVPR